MVESGEGLAEFRAGLELVLATGDLEVVSDPELAALAERLERLAFDNRQHTDLLRLRLSLTVGPVGVAAIGFSGGTSSWNSPGCSTAHLCDRRWSIIRRSTSPS